MASRASSAISDVSLSSRRHIFWSSVSPSSGTSPLLWISSPTATSSCVKCSVSPMVRLPAPLSSRCGSSQTAMSRPSGIKGHVGSSRPARTHASCVGAPVSDVNKKCRWWTSFICDTAQRWWNSRARPLVHNCCVSLTRNVQGDRVPSVTRPGITQEATFCLSSTRNVHGVRTLSVTLAEPDKRQDDAEVAMVSGVTKKSRLPGTATATHGLRKPRGSRGGPLAGALHPMPAEASSAVI